METIDFILSFVSANPGDNPIPTPGITPGAATGDFTAFSVGFVFALIAICFFGLYAFKKFRELAKEKNVSSDWNQSENKATINFVIVVTIIVCSLLSFSMFSINAAHADINSNVQSNTVFAYVNEETGEISIDPYSIVNESGIDFKLLSVTCDVHEQAKVIEGMTNFNFQIFDSSQNALYNNTLNNTQQMQGLYVIENSETLNLNFAIQNMSLDTAKNLIAKPGICVSLHTEEYDPTTYNEITFEVDPAEAGSLDTEPILFKDGSIVTYSIDKQNCKITFDIDSENETITRFVNLNSSYQLDNFLISPTPSTSGEITQSSKITAKCSAVYQPSGKIVYNTKDETYTFYYDGIDYYNKDCYVYNLINDTVFDESSGDINFPAYIVGTSWAQWIFQGNKVVIDDSFANCNSYTSCSFWFIDGIQAPCNFEGLENLNLEQVTNFECMFGNLTPSDIGSYYNLNLSDLNLNNKDISKMFCNNCLLEELTFGKSNFAPINLTKMLYECNHLKRLDLSAIDTTNVSSYDDMFYDCCPNSITIGPNWSIPLDQCGLDSTVLWRAPDGTTCNSSQIFCGAAGKGAGEYILQSMHERSFSCTVRTNGFGAVDGPVSDFSFKDYYTFRIENNSLFLKADGTGNEWQWTPKVYKNETFVKWHFYFYDDTDIVLCDDYYNEDVYKYGGTFIAEFLPPINLVQFDLDGGSASNIPDGWNPVSENDDKYVKPFYSIMSKWDIFTDWKDVVFNKENYLFAGLDYSLFDDSNLIKACWAKPENVHVWDINQLDVQTVSDDGLTIYDDKGSETITLKNCSIEDYYGNRSIKINNYSYNDFAKGIPPEDFTINNNSNRNISNIQLYIQGNFPSISLYYKGDFALEMEGSYLQKDIISINLLNERKTINSSVVCLPFDFYHRSYQFMQDKIVVVFADE